MSELKTVRPRKKTVKPVEEEIKQEEIKQEEIQKVQQETQELSFRERMEVAIQSNLQQIIFLKTTVQELRRLQREHDQLIKVAMKQGKKKAPRDFSKPRRPTGFAEPIIVSNELYSFLVKNKATMKDPSFSPSSQEEYDNWPRIPVKTGSPIARTDVTSFINSYIKSKNLQNPEFKREIIPDAALKKLFSEPMELSDKNDPNSRKIYTYLQLQRYLSSHYPKKTIP